MCHAYKHATALQTSDHMSSKGNRVIATRVIVKFVLEILDND